MAVGLVYSTTTGNTETVAGYIADQTGLTAVDIADLSGDDVKAFDGLRRVSGVPASERRQHITVKPGSSPGYGANR